MAFNVVLGGQTFTEAVAGTHKGKVPRDRAVCREYPFVFLISYFLSDYNLLMSTVLTCSEDGDIIGTIDKAEAHTGDGILHRAFSVFVFSPDGTQVLIQQRASGKLFAGLWANACCSHPRGEGSLEEEAMRRLQEECGFSCALHTKASFVYQAADPSGNGGEYEYDTVLTGKVDPSVALRPDPAEIAEIRWVDIDDLRIDLDENPERYAPWFAPALFEALS